jgi:hypothetical protein
MITISEYYEQPSDCRGDGYDIALAPHVDDKARVEIHPDHVIWREEIRAGGTTFATAPWFVGYHCRRIDLDDRMRRELARRPALKCVRQWVTKATGGWQWARTRGYYRCALVDESLHHRRVSERGYLATLSRSRDLCGDYEGGAYGYAADAEHFARLADAVNAMLDAARRVEEEMRRAA